MPKSAQQRLQCGPLKSFAFIIIIIINVKEGIEFKLLTVSVVRFTGFSID